VPKRLVVLTGVLVLAVSACQGSVPDPVGDANEVDYSDVDLVEAGVDYRTDTTTLWLRYAPQKGPAQRSAWEISTDQDTAAEVTAAIGFNFASGSELDRFVVYQSATDPRCSGYVQNRGFNGEDTVSLQFDTRCLTVPPSAQLANSVRIRGLSGSGRYSGDQTAWTAAVPRS